MNTHNIGFYNEIRKLSFNYHQISSNMHIISSSGSHGYWHRKVLSIVWVGQYNVGRCLCQWGKSFL